MQADQSIWFFPDSHPGEECDTIFYQGIGSSQTQGAKYTVNPKSITTTGERMWCTGRNNLLPIKVIYNLHIGEESPDINLCPFSRFSSLFNPVNWVGAAISWKLNRRNGMHFEKAIPKATQSVVFHAPILRAINIGQDTDIHCHYKKYTTWLEAPNRKNRAILWGCSRGTAATFCAFAKYQYKEVALVVLEGAIDSVSEVIPRLVGNIFKWNAIANPATHILNTSLTFFQKKNVMQYKPNGPSPINYVDAFPENVPVVFITSNADTVVTRANTENIANALARKKKNDVYLIILNKSRHTRYMFDDKEDHDCYEACIHAIYQRYNLKHNPALAEIGKALLPQFTVYEQPKYVNNYALD